MKRAWLFAFVIVVNFSVAVSMAYQMGRTAGRDSMQKSFDEMASSFDKMYGNFKGISASYDKMSKVAEDCLSQLRAKR